MQINLISWKRKFLFALNELPKFISLLSVSSNMFKIKDIEVDTLHDIVHYINFQNTQKNEWRQDT